MDTIDDLIQNLKRVHGDTFGMFVKAWGYHWNVTGPEFIQLHSMFGDIYTELFTAIDTIAETTRTLNTFCPASMRRFIELSTIYEDMNVPTAREMIRGLIEANAIVIASLRRAVEASKRADKEEITNILATRLEVHTKHNWMLTALVV